jgi:uncharacterized protein YdaT
MSTRKSSTKNEGEGSKTAARKYNQSVQKFAQSGKVEEAAKRARKDVEGARGGELREAERQGKQPAQGVEGEARFSEEAYPWELEELEPDVRRKALERANELIQQGYQEIRALRMATTLAREWVDNGKSSDMPMSGPSQHVMFERDSWVICPEDRSEATHSFSNLEDAIRRAHEIATEKHSAVYVYDADGAIIDKYENYGSSTDENVVHVVPYEKGWALQRTGQDGVFERFETKKQALDEARNLAKNEHTTLIVHYQSGEVQHQVSYS